MTNDQENHLNTQLTVSGFCDNNSCSLNNFPAYTNSLTNLAEINSLINSVSGQQMLGLSGITNNKNQFRNNLIVLGADTSRKLTAYAILNNNLTLAGEVKYTETDLRRSSDLQLRDYVQIVYNKAQDIIEELTDYGITPATQEDLAINISSFNNVISAPRLGITTKSQATKQLAELFKQADITLEKLDAVVEIIRLTDPVFYNGYRSARKIVYKGNTKLSAKGTVTDAQSGEPVKGVVISFVLDGQTNGSATELVKKSAAKGGFMVKSLPVGTYHVSFKKSGYVEQQVTAYINEGDLTVLDVALVRNGD